MIQAKDITVAVPCAFENEDPIWMMRASCRKYGLSLRPYAMNKVYNGWTELKIYLLREEALSCPTSHILYTDAGMRGSLEVQRRLRRNTMRSVRPR